MKYLKTIFLALMIIFSLCAMCACISSNDTSKGPVTFTDMAGREVSLKAPANKVVLCNARFIQELAAIVGPDFVKHMAGMGTDLRTMESTTYEIYAAKYPEIKNIPEIGHFSTNNIDVEKIISLKPDVVFIQTWWLQSSKEVTSKLEAAGIPVVYIDFSDDPINGPPKSIEIMGKVMGREERAQEIASYYNKYVKLVQERISSTSSKPTVYIEMGNQPLTYGRTYGKIGWGNVVIGAGGDNITANIIQKMGVIEPEFLLSSDPDIIILTAMGGKGDDLNTFTLGYNIDRNNAKSVLEKYTGRTGWKNLKAVKNGNVYGIYHTYSIQMYNFYSLLSFAKWFYPEEFEDVNPDQVLEEFHKKFAVVDYSGTWSVKLD